jgi:hypothetical protein
MTLSLVVEGPTDEPVARALAEDAGFHVGLVREAMGKSKLDARLSAFAAAAQLSPWLVGRDLDQDAGCAPAWLVGKPTARWLCLRLAIRETEAWLLGDRERFAEYFKVAVSKVPENPELLTDPKRALVDLVRHSTSLRLRRDVVPRDGAHTQVGPGYVASIIEYASTSWRISVAARRCDSLRRARTALSDMARRWNGTVGA